MKLCFKLSMPGNSSWNGKWTGDNEFYARVKSFTNSKMGNALVDAIISNAPYNYSFGDGWRARVDVEVVATNVARSIERRSKGFCGYDWMISSIMRTGCILSSDAEDFSQAVQDFDALVVSKVTSPKKKRKTVNLEYSSLRSFTGDAVEFIKGLVVVSNNNVVILSDGAEIRRFESLSDLSDIKTLSDIL